METERNLHHRQPRAARLQLLQLNSHAVDVRLDKLMTKHQFDVVAASNVRAVTDTPSNDYIQARDAMINGAVRLFDCVTGLL